MPNSVTGFLDQRRFCRPARPARFGVLSDLHLGRSMPGRGHNRLLHDQAETLACLAVAALNRQPLDAVFVLGDLTDDGTPQQVDRARHILSSLIHPWYVVPGDHDRMAVRSGVFDQLLGSQAAPAYFRISDGIGVVSLREDAEAVTDAFRFDGLSAARSLAALQADTPRTLLVLSHFPLVCQRTWAAVHNGRHAACPPDGPLLLSHLSACVRQRVVVLCGHQHWHHSRDGANWVQCATGSMLEYPMEVRMVTLAGDALYVETLAAGVACQRRDSLDRAKWVAGGPMDRAAMFTL